MLRDPERRIARAMWGVTIGMVVIHDRHAGLLLHAALERPCPGTIRSLLEAGRNTPWLSGLLNAVDQVGVVAAGDFLEDQP